MGYYCDDNDEMVETGILDVSGRVIFGIDRKLNDDDVVDEQCPVDRG